MTWVQSLGQEDLLEKEMATHSSHSCLENPVDRGALRATVHGVAKESDMEKKKIRHNLATKQQQQFREVKKNSLLLGMKSPDSDKIR